MVKILDLVGLRVYSHSQYDEFFRIKKDYEHNLLRHSIKKSRNTIDSDVRTAVLLGQEDRFINTQRVYSEPFLVTWDSSFRFLRDSVHTDTSLSSWHLYTPYKLVDRISVMEFKVDPENINMNIASLIEEDFSTSTKFSSFFDVLSSYFQTPDVGRLSIAKKLVELKDRTFGVGEKHDVSSEREDYSPLTDILINTREHYYTNKSRYKFHDVIMLFEDPEYEQQLLEKIRKAMSDYADITSFANSLDVLIESRQ